MVTTGTMPVPRRARESVFTGLAGLIRFALRRDRIRLSVWVAALTGLMAYAPYSLELAYPEEAQRLARVNLMKTPAGMMFGGPIFGVDETDLGVMVANELMLTMIIAASIMSILTVIRYTRADEENGAAELVLASAVGRQARTTAALAVAALVNAVLTVTMTAALALTGFGVIDSAAMCIGITAVSMVFAATAAVTAQLWRQTRAATGAAMATLGAAVLIRGIGDVIDNSGSTLSWLSPIAWAQQMRAFVDVRWWPLGLLLALTVLLIGAAAFLETRRQYDAGTLRSRGDDPDARPIVGVLDLYFVLQRGQTIGWAVAMLVFGAAMGSMIKALVDAAATNELLAQILTAGGTNSIHTVVLQFLAAAVTAYVVTAVYRVRNDEESGLGEAVLARPVSRWRWLISAVVSAIAGAALVMTAAGLGAGLGAGLTLHQPGTVALLTLAATAFVPAFAAIAGVAALAVALRSPWVGWLAVTFVVATLYLGALLRLPQWLIDLSPISQTNVPTEYPAAALAVMLLVALLSTALAGWIYRRRDAT